MTKKKGVWYSEDHKQALNAKTMVKYNGKKYRFCRTWTISGCVGFINIYF